MSASKSASDPPAPQHKVLGVIELDLRSLATNANRKFPEVKDAVERALLRIRAIHEQLTPSASAAEQAAALAASEEVLLPLMLALACKSDTLPELALKAVQRMLSHNAVAPQRLPAVVSQLIARAQSPAADEPSLLRVLQTVLTIASSPALLHNDTVVAQLLLLCLTLQQHRSGNIRNTAVATVQQFIALLLDIVASEPDPTAGSRGDMTQRPELGSLSVAARCTFLAFQDLCLLANGESAQWLPGTGPVRIQFALEMVQRTLQSHSELFMHRRPFQYALSHPNPNRNPNPSQNPNHNHNPKPSPSPNPNPSPSPNPNPTPNPSPTPHPHPDQVPAQGARVPAAAQDDAAALEPTGVGGDAAPAAPDGDPALRLRTHAAHRGRDHPLDARAHAGRRGDARVAPHPHPRGLPRARAGGHAHAHARTHAHADTPPLTHRHPPSPALCIPPPCRSPPSHPPAHGSTRRCYSTSSPRTTWATRPRACWPRSPRR